MSIQRRAFRSKAGSVAKVQPPRRQQRAQFYVYRLIDPRFGSVFYVGKGQGQRAWSHQARVIAGNYDGNSAKADIILAIVEAGLSVKVEIVERFADADDALDLEYRLIEESPHLTNDRRGFNSGAQVEARLKRLREAKTLRLERAVREAEMIRKRLEEIKRFTRSPRALAEAERWITREVRDHLIQVKAQKESKQRRQVRAAS